MKMRTEMLLISTGRSIGKRHFNRIHATAHAAGGAAQRRSSPYRGLLLLLPQLFKAALWTRGSSTPVHSGAAGLPCGNGRLLVCLFHQKSSVWTDARWFGHKCPALASRGARPFFSAVDRHVAVPLTSIQSVWRTSICVFFSVHLYLVLHCSSVSL